LLDFQIANIICSSQIERRIKQLKSFLVWTFGAKIPLHLR
jgi:hypothetical protein